jgi:plasmid stabilization system protein ParE
MTGRINFTPEAERQLKELDDWITKVASADIARRFVSAILDHIDGILVFPLAGRARRRPTSATALRCVSSIRGPCPVCVPSQFH